MGSECFWVLDRDQSKAKNFTNLSENDSSSQDNETKTSIVSIDNNLENLETPKEHATVKEKVIDKELSVKDDNVSVAKDADNETIM